MPEQYDNPVVQQEAESLEQDGLVLGGIPKLQAEWLERMLDSPLPVFGEAFARTGWRKVKEDLRREERKCRIPALQERIRAARVMASKMPAGASPWDAMKAMWEIEQQAGVQMCDGVARRYMRESCYKVMNKEYAGRQVG